MEKKFAEGFMYRAPAENAPSFVKGRVSFRVEEFKKFLDDNRNENGFVNVDILESRAEGKYYGQLNDWKKAEGIEKSEVQDHAAPPLDYPEEINPADIPF